MRWELVAASINIRGGGATMALLALCPLWTSGRSRTMLGPARIGEGQTNETGRVSCMNVQLVVSRCDN